MQHTSLALLFSELSYGYILLVYSSLPLTIPPLFHFILIVCLLNLFSCSGSLFFVVSKLLSSTRCIISFSATYTSWKYSVHLFKFYFIFPTIFVLSWFLPSNLSDLYSPFTAYTSWKYSARLIFSFF